MSLEQNEVNKGYLFLGLGWHLGIEIYPSEFSIDKIFRVNSFVDGVRFMTKMQGCSILPLFLIELHENRQIPIDSKLFMRIVSVF